MLRHGIGGGWESDEDMLELYREAEGKALDCCYGRLWDIYGNVIGEGMGDRFILENIPDYIGKKAQEIMHIETDASKQKENSESTENREVGERESATSR